MTCYKSYQNILSHSLFLMWFLRRQSLKLFLLNIYLRLPKEMQFFIYMRSRINQVPLRYFTLSQSLNSLDLNVSQEKIHKKLPKIQRIPKYDKMLGFYFFSFFWQSPNVMLSSYHSFLGSGFRVD